MTNRIQQPGTLDLVGDPILVGGTATGFEAVVQYRVSDGHDEVTGHVMVGGGSGEHAQYQLQVDVSGAAFTLPRLFIDVFEESPEDGSEVNRVTVPVIYGPLLVPGYYGYREHVVAAGETLWGIARAHYGDGNLFHRIATANPQTISDPSVIVPGLELRIPIGT